MPDQPNIFADRETGQLIKIKSVDESYAKIIVLTDTPMGYSMPRKEYEEFFVERYRPATPEDLRKEEADIEYPLNAVDDPDWNVLTDGPAAE